MRFNDRFDWCKLDLARVYNDSDRDLDRSRDLRARLSLSFRHLPPSSTAHGAGRPAAEETPGQHAKQGARRTCAQICKTSPLRFADLKLSQFRREQWSLTWRFPARTTMRAITSTPLPWPRPRLRGSLPLVADTACSAILSRRLYGAAHRCRVAVNIGGGKLLVPLEAGALAVG